MRIRIGREGSRPERRRAAERGSPGRHSISPMRTGLAARNGGRVGLIALVAILLLGLGLRVGYAWEGRAPVYDARAYAAIAANLDRGHGFTVGPAATQPSSNYSPGLPLSAAAAYELS